MNNNLYKRILKSVDNQVKSIINEQFNVNDIDFTDDSNDYDANIFNKEAIININKIYKKLLKNKINKDEIYLLNTITSAIKPKDKTELQKIIEYYSEKYPNESLNWLDVSNITDMSYIFAKYNQYSEKNIFYNFNGDISKWDVSNVEDMEGMFQSSKFNKNISNWNVSNVKNMSYMFRYSNFNKDISRWDVSNVKNMSYMFNYSEFNQDISNWNVSNVWNMRSMFSCSNFTGDISKWDISNVKNFQYIFNCCEIDEKNTPTISLKKLSDLNVKFM